MSKVDITAFKINRNKTKLDEEEIALLDSLSEEQIKDLIKEHEKNYNYYNALQNGLKLSLNSIYGAFGNKHFVCSTTDISEGITAMGRDILKYMDRINEIYWYEHWHNDTDLHELLGIDTTQIKPIDDKWIHRESKQLYEGNVTEQDVVDGIYQRRTAVSIYGDTDSIFIGFQPGIDSCGWNQEMANKYLQNKKAKDPNFKIEDHAFKDYHQIFVEAVAYNRLQPLFKKKLDNYAKKYKVENLEDFEMENINESIIFLQKKMYIKHTIWEDGTQYPRLENIVPKNVSLIKKGTPPFARDKVMEIIHYIFDNHKNIKLNEILKFVRDQRKQFEMVDSKDDIFESTNINMYWSQKIIEDGVMIDGPGIVKDDGDLVFGKLTYHTVKAAGLYNYLLNQHKDLKVKYEIIKPGFKVKMYPCKHEKNEKFAYPAGSYPSEFAPDIDYDELFEKNVSKQVNIYLKCLGMPELNKRLKIVMPIF